MKTKPPKTIPTFLALLLLGVTVFLGVFLIKRSQTFSLKANPQNTPQEVKITNVSDTSFTVSWITKSSIPGFLGIGETSQLGQSAEDDRDKGTGAKESFFTHYVTVQNLKSSTKYYFKIYAGSLAFDNNGKPYEVTTGPAINLPLPAADAAFGVILEAGGNPAKGAIVYLGLANTTPLSSLVKNDGSWVIPLSMARNLSLTNYSSYDKEIQVEEIFVQGANMGTATAICTTKNDNPVPSLTLGQTYDFRQPTPTGQPVGEIAGFQPAGLATSSAPTSNLTGTPAVQPTSKPGFNPESSTFLPAGSSRLNVLNPQEGEVINTQRPEIIGTAPSEKILEILVESDLILSGQILTDETGSWKWSPPADLSPGEHTITVSLKDDNGLIQKVTRKFTVLAVGENELPSFTATPSGEISLTPSPEPTRIVGTPTPTPSQPPTGSLTVTAFFLIMGVILIIIGYNYFQWTNQ